LSSWFIGTFLARQGTTLVVRGRGRGRPSSPRPAAPSDPVAVGKAEPEPEEGLEPTAA
jgi:hypothetical protein